MLELGKAGTGGVGKGVLPVLRDGAVVATLQAANWKEAATATIGDQQWVYAKRKSELTARWAVDPEGTARLSARQTSFWKGTWAVDLEGVKAEVAAASVWKGTHRYTVAGRPVGESGTSGGWSLRPTLALDPAVPLHHQVFLLWLELVISRRNTAAITAATGAAVAGGTS